jgi:DHA1 family multidrug resistance protein-like MFS transporter
MAVAAVPSALIAANTGRVAGWLGFRVMLFLCLLGAGIFTLPQALVRGFGELLGLRVAMGLFFGGVLPAANAMVGQSTAPERRATAFGVSASATLAGQATGPLIAGFLAAGVGLREVFLLSGAILLAAALLAGLSLREPAPHP